MQVKRAEARVLLAPNAYKCTLSAPEAAACMRDILSREMPEVTPLCCPIADGGDDTLTVLALSDPLFEWHEATVCGPVPESETIASYLYQPRKRLVVLEAAQAHGLVKLPEGRLAAMAATSYGVGELMRQTITAHPDLQTLVVTLGGSASTDGGLGALQALGVAFIDGSGRPLDTPIGGCHLSEIRAVRWQDLPNGPEILIATDVVNPLLGPQGTARVFAPQKGASSEECVRLEDGLAQVTALLRAQREDRIEDEPGAGAAGGLGYGLRLLPRSRIVSGFDWIAEALDLPEKVQAGDLIITGEGRLDATSLSGKGVGGLIRLAAGRPVWVVCGDVVRDLSLPPQVRVFSMARAVGSLEEAMAKPMDAMQAVMRQVVSEMRTLLPG